MERVDPGSRLLVIVLFFILGMANGFVYKELDDIVLKSIKNHQKIALKDLTRKSIYYILTISSLRGY